MNRKTGIRLAIFVVIVVGLLSVAAYEVVKIDPYMHYHKPLTESYFYVLNNERGQNDGITRNMDYDAIITGTSMTQNFKTTELDELFGVKSIKIPYSGGSYKEINDAEEKALTYNPDIKMIVRSLDMSMLLMDKDFMRDDLGEFPTYLYDDNIFNDVNYIFNRDILLGRAYQMMKSNDRDNFTPGITSFDDYSSWMDRYTFGRNAVCPNGVNPVGDVTQAHLTDKEKEEVLKSVKQNITSLADEYKNVQFYYFIPPYSVVWYRDNLSKGEFYKYIEAEKIMMEEILKHDNIRLFAFGNMTTITTDLNNYKDVLHYASWVNTLMLNYMKTDRNILTEENYEKYIQDEIDIYSTFDFDTLNKQNDYENDYYAAALLNNKITGVEPLDLMTMVDSETLESADKVSDQYYGQPGVECHGSLDREVKDSKSVAEYVYDVQYIGAKITVKDIGKYNYLVFYGKLENKNGQPGVYIYDDKGKKISELSESYHDIDNNWKQYIIDISKIKGDVTIIFNGGYIDNSGDPDSAYVFSGMKLY